MLILGTDKTAAFLTTLPESYLLIDDGPIIDALDLPRGRKVMRFDVGKHSFNPLQGMTYARACSFVELIEAAFPGGDTTLTKQDSSILILDALINKSRRLDRLMPKTKETRDAYQKIKRILLSPVLNRVLLGEPNFTVSTFKGIVVARLDRALLGSFDCFLLGNMLISQYQGQIVVPDFGFYACPFHSQLLRQGRLIAGVNYLNEIQDRRLRQQLLMEEKIPCRTSFDDAEEVARYDCRYPKGTNGYDGFVATCMQNAP